MNFNKLFPNRNNIFGTINKNPFLLFTDEDWVNYISDQLSSITSLTEVMQMPQLNEMQIIYSVDGGCPNSTDLLKDVVNKKTVISQTGGATLYGGEILSLKTWGLYGHEEKVISVGAHKLIIQGWAISKKHRWYSLQLRGLRYEKDADEICEIKNIEVTDLDWKDKISLVKKFKYDILITLSTYANDAYEKSVSMTEKARAIASQIFLDNCALNSLSKTPNSFNQAIKQSYQLS